MIVKKRASALPVHDFRFLSVFTIQSNNMKIITWNINGIRTFGGGVKKTLDSLDADVICVQETKVTRDLLDERSAIVDGYNSYFSYSRGRSGYSGVATYCKDSATPCAAEEGLTGLLTGHEGAVGCYGDHTEFSGEELQLLDNEGRAVITQHRVMCEDKVQTVTVINVYCPRADPDKPERKQFKLQFYKLLQCRAEALLKDGSHVIILGDVNTSHRPIDHCDPSDVDQFGENPGRKWLNGTSTDSVRGGKFVDTFRYFHPTRSSAFTCWSTLTGARQTNYGTRIDYIFADRRLVREQFVAADIMPEVEGSDHCPVWGRLRCPLVPSSKPPPLCTRYLPEFAGRQQKLSRFLVKVEPTSTKTVKTCSKPQGSLLSFFKPKPTTNAVPLLTLRPGSVTKSLRHRTHTKRLQPEKLTADKHDRQAKTPQPDRGASSLVFWKSILHGPPPPPSCKVHGEPCVLRTVKKEGPNMGKQFFVCARPQGHASNPEARCNFFSWKRPAAVL
uniref:DNA-(apurinic or apyrimidinic site) endonuclease n=1 Tax=Scophthalmus maximus TaxID=52904 RepID=A0A8D3AN58_SCOMX